MPRSNWQHCDKGEKEVFMTVSQREQDEFRTEVATWLNDNKPGDPGFLLPLTFMEVGSDRQFDFLREWQHKLWSAGFLGMAWPKEYGGGGLPAVFQQIADAEMDAARVPIAFNAIGLGWAGPLINDTGTELEKARYLKNILTAEDIWCQGFSEPDNGSDLGNARTRAVREGDEYVVNGTKTWTTLGNYADYMILLARTDPDPGLKHRGLSYFLAPMKIPGIEARPIRKLTGEYGFTETFFTDARIPADCLMGEEGQGWKISMQTLKYERGAEAGAAGGLMNVRLAMNDVIQDIKSIMRDGDTVLADPLIRDQLLALLIEEHALELGKSRVEIPALCSDYPFSLPLARKLRTSEYARRLRQFAVQAQGGHGSLYVGDGDSVAGGLWQRAYFNNFATTIGGGTSQIQANIIGEQVLGLPRS
jgi:alkylation response protein AidB-like acyl-CoA dehydrogenase